MAIDYEWRLRLLMAERGMFKATDLAPRLAVGLGAVDVLGGLAVGVGALVARRRRRRAG